MNWKKARSVIASIAPFVTMIGVCVIAANVFGGPARVIEIEKVQESHQMQIDELRRQSREAYGELEGEIKFLKGKVSGEIHADLVERLNRLENR